MYWVKHASFPPHHQLERSPLSLFCTTMLRPQVSSPSLKIAVATVQSMGSNPSSPGLPRGLSPFNLHNQGSAPASPQYSPRFLDFHPTAPRSPTIAKSLLGSDKHSSLFNASTPAEPAPPGASSTTKARMIIGKDAPGDQTEFQDEPIASVETPSRQLRFELPPIAIEGLPLHQGLPGFASFDFGNVHSVTYRSTRERLPTPYPPREDLDWLEVQDEAELFALSVKEVPGSEPSTPGVSLKPSSSFLLSGFPTALCLSREEAASTVKKSLPPLQRKSISHSKSLNALDTLTNGSLIATSSSLPSSRPSARPMLLSALSSALARRERSRRIRFEALPFAIHVVGDDSRRSSQYCVPSPPAGRALDADLMFDSMLLQRRPRPI